MKKKITHSVLFVAVLAGTTALTLFAGRGNLSSTIYNFVFLAVIAVLYLIFLTAFGKIDSNEISKVLLSIILYIISYGHIESKINLSLRPKNNLVKRGILLKHTKEVGERENAKK